MKRRLKRLAAPAAAAMTFAVLGGIVPAHVAISVAAAPPAPSVRLVGNHLVDGSGKTLRLIGVNHGANSSCVQGFGIFDGGDPDPATDAAGIQAMTSWGINAVRVPLNEDCWLGINLQQLDPTMSMSGAKYRQAVQSYIANLHQAGLVAILDLHWNGPGAFVAKEQLAMADADHAPDFWRSVATTFLGDPGVVFDLFNEPKIDANATTADPWTCWLNGCTIKAGNSENDTTSGPPFDWQSAGMQSLVNAVRATGSRQPVILGGLDDANDLSGWLAHRPTDPASQLGASFHNYQGQPCSDVTCWNAQVLPVAEVVPVVTGEFGGGSQPACSPDFTNGYMAWADAHGVSYLAWAWGVHTQFDGPLKDCFSIITDYVPGTPTVPYGKALKDHFLAVPATPPDSDLGLTGVPANSTVVATSPTGAAVTYTAPTASDEALTGASVTCDHASGSTFPVGTTTVTCTATDPDDTNSPVTGSFTVTVTAATTTTSSTSTTVPKTTTTSTSTTVPKTTTTSTSTTVPSTTTTSTSTTVPSTTTTSTSTTVPSTTTTSTSTTVPATTTTTTVAPPSARCQALVSMERNLDRLITALESGLQEFLGGRPLQGIINWLERLRATFDSGISVQLAQLNCPSSPTA
jgi:Cellulase (glycosyl hydrolase family 5)/HYR domain